MVKLGFIKDADQSPPEFARVYIAATEDGKAPSAEVRSWPNRDGEQLFEVVFLVPRGEKNLGSWIGYMADTLMRMGWDHWWIDTLSVSQVLDRYIVDAVASWGDAFWPLFSNEAVVLIQVGLQREDFQRCAEKWARKFPHLEVDDEHDYERIALELEAQAQAEREKRPTYRLLRLLQSRNRSH